MAKSAPAAGIASGQCLCGKVAFEIDVPARWAWHDHSPASRRAHGAAYATYVGSWRKRFRVTKGKTAIAQLAAKVSNITPVSDVVWQQGYALEQSGTTDPALLENSLVSLLRLNATDLITIGDPVWFHMPWDYVRGVVMYEIVSWTVLAAIAARSAPRSL